MSGTENKPVSVGEWIVTFILLAIPVVNIIMLLVWALGGGAHPSKKSYAQATLILGVGVAAVAIVFMLLATLISFPSGHHVQ